MNEIELYPYEEAHIKALRRLSPECMVLLKHDGSFPLKAVGQIALYGSGARRTLKGGTGSGNVYVRHFVTIEEGLKKAGFAITTRKWMDSYEEEWQKARRIFVDDIKARAAASGVPAILFGMGAVMPEPEYTLPLEGEGDVAIYVLSRVSGEGSDRKAVTGDLLLTETEVRDIHALQQKYNKFLLVLNVGGVVDLEPVQDISNILVMSQPGMAVGDAFADVLLGKSYPSGKLTTTWASWEDYCQVGDFGAQDDTHYCEGVYVGYRYFDTVNQKLLYPFGYGLGYTDFEIMKPEVTVIGTKVTVNVQVNNVGSYSGKEVLQLYVSVPSGKLDQPYQTLAAFTKTRELAGKEAEVVTLEFSLEELASYDDTRAAKILEPGDYIIRLGNSSRSTHICGIVSLEKEVVVKTLKHVGGTPDFKDWKPESAAWTYTNETMELAQAERFVIKTEDFEELCANVKHREISSEVHKLIDGLSDSDLAYLCIGNFRTGEESDSVIGNAAFSVAGAAGETTQRFTNQGIPFLVTADGPAGLRLARKYGKDENGIYTLINDLDSFFQEFADEQVMAFLGMKKDTIERNGEVHYQYCSAIPIGTALAQSWNLSLVEACGDLVGDEMERFGIHLWLAPALNIHRSPLCGRNFEYYSEDPFISGKMAAAMTKGVQTHPGCGVTVKHFVCNNQETNRFFSNSIVSERALRDIYLRGFEIVIHEANPYALMTSYNLLNGEHTSARSDLLAHLLREEWGYEGLIMSDWVTSSTTIDPAKKHPSACASGSIKAGNDLMMPGGGADHEDLMKAITDPNHRYQITRENLLTCAANVVNTALKLTGKVVS